MTEVTHRMKIMRGVPGSGKSTIARVWAKKHNAVICSADDYFINMKTGAYEWTQDRLRYAHEYCQKVACAAMRQGINLVIDNTNIKIKVVKGYIELAKAHNYCWDIHTVNVWDAALCASRNAHGVPLVDIQRMIDTFEPEADYL